MCTRNLTFAFFSPREEDHWMNKLVAKVSKFPYCHVELYFESTNQCFSILWGSVAELRTKTLQSDCYEIVTLAVSLAEYDACLESCRQISMQRKTFDDRGMFLSYCGWNCCRARNSTFCSQVICDCLQAGNVYEVQRLNADNATPSQLYACIMHSQRRICASVPYKRAQMLNKKTIVFQNAVYNRVVDIF